MASKEEIQDHFRAKMDLHCCEVAARCCSTMPHSHASTSVGDRYALGVSFRTLGNAIVYRLGFQHNPGSEDAMATV
jgi:hypothetical protein